MNTTKGVSMRKGVATSGMLVTLVLLATGCVVEPRDNYYDRDHHRYYSEHTWHECGDHEDRCR